MVIVFFYTDSSYPYRKIPYSEDMNSFEFNTENI